MLATNLASLCIGEVYPETVIYSAHLFQYMKEPLPVSVISPFLGTKNERAVSALSSLSVTSYSMAICVCLPLGFLGWVSCIYCSSFKASLAVVLY